MFVELVPMENAGVTSGVTPAAVPGCVSSDVPGTIAMNYSAHTAANVVTSFTTMYVLLLIVLQFPSAIHLIVWSIAVCFRSMLIMDSCLVRERAKEFKVIRVTSSA